MTYSVQIERGDVNYPQLEPLYRQHYGEMQARLAGDGMPIGDYAPRLDAYFDAFASGRLVNYVVRCDGVPVGYANVWLTLDMHNGEPIAQEDLLYVLPDHRNGTGRKLVQHILRDLEARGIKRVHITPVTDLRVGKIWKRMGFRDVAQQMIYIFKGAEHVRT